MPARPFHLPIQRASGHDHSPPPKFEICKLATTHPHNPHNPRNSQVMGVVGDLGAKVMAQLSFPSFQHTTGRPTCGVLLGSHKKLAGKVGRQLFDFGGRKTVIFL